VKERKLDVRFLGTLDYPKSLDLQKEYHSQIRSGERESTLLLVEHTPVITLGKHASSLNVLVSTEYLKEAGIALERVDRGGEATAHEPGQLVIYPLLDLRLFQLGPKAYVHKLEDTIIELLADYSITGRRDESFPGVWVKNEKVCSVGIRISGGVSYHGMALNVSNSLETFTKIVPCGIQDRGLNSISRLLGKDLPLFDTADHFQKIFCRNFKVAATFFKD
jgi:lipoate-protein ligase B